MVAIIFTLRKLAEAAMVWVFYVVCCLVGEFVLGWEGGEESLWVMYLGMPIGGFCILAMGVLLPIIVVLGGGELIKHNLEESKRTVWLMKHGKWM